MLLGADVVGLIQYSEESTPQYRHAGHRPFLDPAVHGRGVGRDCVRTLARHLILERGHHRLVIDPAADNEAAIRCYASVGFRPVGVMRSYERDVDGRGWHDGLLMDLLAAELVAPLTGVGSGSGGSDVEAELDDVAVGHDVVLALDADLALRRVASAIEPAATRSSKETTSALMKPFWKSVWITPAASGAVAPLWIVQARDSFGPAVR